MEHDVAVIGGGPAGLAGALALVRARKRVVLFDRWPPRKAAATEVRGFVTQDGVPPAEMRRQAHEELARYAGFELREDDDVTAIERGPEGGSPIEIGPEGFTVVSSSGRTRVRRVLLACGLVDELPDLPGYRALWGTSLFQCPYCHGWEVRDRAFGYLAPDTGCADWSLILRAWTEDLVVFTSGRFEVPAELRDQLARGGVRLEERRVVGLRAEAGALAAVQLEGGGEVARDILFVRPPQRQTALVTRLGIALEAPDRVRVQQHETSIPGIFAAGDLALHHHSALAAAASGAAAAHALDEGLTQELVLAGML